MSSRSGDRVWYSSIKADQSAKEGLGSPTPIARSEGVYPFVDCGGFARLCASLHNSDNPSMSSESRVRWTLLSTRRTGVFTRSVRIASENVSRTFSSDSSYVSGENMENFYSSAILEISDTNMMGNAYLVHTNLRTLDEYLQIVDGSIAREPIVVEGVDRLLHATSIIRK